jgi:GT2 family glycosyltransferase
MSFPFVAPDPPRPNRPATKAPSLSVVIAAYQSAKTIREAVESALEQTLPPHEVIVCDDGSTDGTERVLDPYRDRIVYVRKENGGEASAKNVAARAASGEFVVILDADDVFLPERLEALAELARVRPDLDILTTDAYLEIDGEVIERCYSGGMRFISKDQRCGILASNFVFGLAAVRRERLLAVGGFDEAIRWTTDWDCWIRMILDGSRVGLVDEPLARYRLHAASLSSQREHLIAGRLETLGKAVRRNDLSSEERQVVRRAIAGNRRMLALARARSALLEKRPEARRLSLAVAAGPGVGLRTRLKALFAATAPVAAGRRLGSGDVETTGGIRVAMDREPRERG